MWGCGPQCPGKKPKTHTLLCSVLSPTAQPPATRGTSERGILCLERGTKASPWVGGGGQGLVRLVQRQQRSPESKGRQAGCEREPAAAPSQLCTPQPGPEVTCRHPEAALPPPPALAFRQHNAPRPSCLHGGLSPAPGCRWAAPQCSSPGPRRAAG